MIVFQGIGRLGNQFLQLGFALAVGEREGERVLAYQFDELGHVCDIDSQTCQHQPLPNIWVHRVFNRILFPFGRLLGRLRILGQLREVNLRVEGETVSSGEYIRRRGLLPVTIAEKGYYQFNTMVRPQLSNLPLKQTHLDAAAAWLERSIPEGATPVFVHVRRGDYLQWAKFGRASAALPRAYYRESMKAFRQHCEKPFFCFLGDDPDYCRSFSEEVGGMVVSDQTMAVDLAIMSLCHGGVLSASSFAWCGASLGSNDGVYYAPEYWIGWGTHHWYPRGLSTSPFQWVPVALEVAQE